MVSRGEVALIIAANGLAANLLAKENFTAIVIVVILTTIITPPLLKKYFVKRKSLSEVGKLFLLKSNSHVA